MYKVTEFAEELNRIVNADQAEIAEHVLAKYRDRAKLPNDLQKAYDALIKWESLGKTGYDCGFVCLNFGGEYGEYLKRAGKLAVYDQQDDSVNTLQGYGRRSFGNVVLEDSPEMYLGFGIDINRGKYTFNVQSTTIRGDYLTEVMNQFMKEHPEYKEKLHFFVNSRLD